MEKQLTIAEASALIAKRKLSPVELTKDCLARIGRLDERLHSFILVLEEAALASARRAEQEIMAGRSRGPLHGIPIGLKDIYNTRGVPTTASVAASAATEASRRNPFLWSSGSCGDRTARTALRMHAVDRAGHIRLHELRGRAA